MVDLHATAVLDVIREVLFRTARDILVCGLISVVLNGTRRAHRCQISFKTKNAYFNFCDSIAYLRKIVVKPLLAEIVCPSNVKDIQ